MQNGKAEVMLTTYFVFYAMRQQLSTVPWSALVFDEAHCMQNPATRNYLAATEPGLWPTAFKLLLTGTPGSKCVLLCV